MKVCAVVVTFNRKQLLEECLNALLIQTKKLDAIYIIDNASTDGTEEMLAEKFLKKDVFRYVKMSENVGGSGGFHEGMKRAYEDGYDWIWIMDDDAEPLKNSLEILLGEIGKKYLVRACLVLNSQKQVDYKTRGYINLKNMAIIPIDDGYVNQPLVEIEFISFVGMLLNRKVIDIIGFPKREFFIHGDDVEYCIRIKKYIGKSALINSSKIYHKDAVSAFREKRKFGKKYYERYQYNKYWLRYFGIRNSIWMGKTYCSNKILFVFKMFIELIKNILGVLLLDDKKYKRVLFLINAHLDGWRSEFDNTKPKKILYGEKGKL